MDTKSKFYLNNEIWKKKTIPNFARHVLDSVHSINLYINKDMEVLFTENNTIYINYVWNKIKKSKLNILNVQTD